jgi:hypothetical protein
VNHLTPEQIKRLALLAGECGAIVSSVMRIVVHGYNSKHHEIPCREDLERRLGSMVVAVDELFQAEDLDQVRVRERILTLQSKVYPRSSDPKHTK